MFSTLVIFLCYFLLNISQNKDPALLSILLFQLTMDLCILMDNMNWMFRGKFGGEPNGHTPEPITGLTGILLFGHIFHVNLEVTHLWPSSHLVQYTDDVTFPVRECHVTNVAKRLATPLVVKTKEKITYRIYLCINFSNLWEKKLVH